MTTGPSARVRLVAANWKMFKTVADAVAYAKEFRALAAPYTATDLVVAPPFTAIAGVASALRGTRIGVAGQDLHWERDGAFTGEVSAAMLAEAGAEWVVVGHSERRRLFCETDDAVNRKVRAALAADLVPIVCVGETLEQRERGETLTVLDRQLGAGLDGLGAELVQRLVIAYEPVWAIGTGVNATPGQAQEAHAHLRGRLRQWFGAPAADACRILYGGSVKPDNAALLGEQPDVDGALVGGASLDPHSFIAIVRGMAGVQS